MCVCACVRVCLCAYMRVCVSHMVDGWIVYYFYFKGPALGKNYTSLYPAPCPALPPTPHIPPSTHLHSQHSPFSWVGFFGVVCIAPPPLPAHPSSSRDSFAPPVLHCAGLERSKGAERGVRREDLVNRGEADRGEGPWLLSLPYWRPGLYYRPCAWLWPKWWVDRRGWDLLC